jgi:hypothetical protein
MFPARASQVQLESRAGVNAMDDDRTDNDPTAWQSRSPVDRLEGTGNYARNAIQFRWWNLLLVLPLLMLFTVIYNKDEPRVLGMPVFYVVQFGFVFIGVASVAIVFAATKDRRPLDDDRRDQREIGK